MNVPPQLPRKGDRFLKPAALGLVALAAAQMATGQTAPAADQTQTPQDSSSSSSSNTDKTITMEAFTVTSGFASSLEAAAKAKESSGAITEVLAAEDLGKLPYVSVADALVSLTGLSSQRTNGRDQEITIRGLGPDYQVGTLDGVEQATTNDNRGVEYDQYPAELIAGAQVFKSGEADRVGGIGGTVDLAIVNPLDFQGRKVALNAFYNWTQYKELTPGNKKAGTSYQASYIDQFANGTEGIFIGYAHTENPYEGQQFQTWGYPTDANGNLVLGGMRIYSTNDLLKRDAVVGVLESKPNDWIHNKLDLLFTYFKEDQILRGMEVPMAEWSSAVLQPGYTVTNGAITSYTLTNVQPVIRNMATNRTDHMASVIDNLELAEKSEWPVHIVGGFSKVTRLDQVLEEYSGLAFNQTATDADTFKVVQNAGQLPQVTASVNYANASLFTMTDPQSWGTGVFPTTGMEGYLKYFQEEDIADSGKISTKHELDASILKDVEIGVSYSERFKQQGQNPTGYLVNSNGQPTAALPALIGTTDLSFIGNLHPIAFDPVAEYNSGALKFVPNPNPGSWEGDNFKVWEKITRPFVQFDMKGNVGVPFTGNIGGVVDFANQSSTGFSGDGGPNIVAVSGGSSYATFLPSLNLVFNLTDKDLIRFSAGRQEARPPMYEMRAARTYSYNATDATSTTISPWSGNAGNPNLRPWLSDSLDLSYEHYFSRDGSYVALAGFSKDLLSYIYQQNTLASFAGYPYTSSTAPLINNGVVSEFQNGKGGHLSGVEATIQLTSKYLTGGAVDGFGLTVNGSLADSSIQPWGPGNGTAPLDNLSKKVANVTLYYENHGFTARVSTHYQSATREYITTFGVPTFSSQGTPNDGYSVEIPEHTISAQVSYAFEHGPFKNITVYLEGTNLNNEPLITYNNNDPRQLANYQKYGASYKSGVSYKF